MHQILTCKQDTKHNKLGYARRSMLSIHNLCSGMLVLKSITQYELQNQDMVWTDG